VTAPEWRDCADPDELAAAVAAGVEVRAMGRAGDFPTANQTADQFAGSLRAGITYRIPTSWTWHQEPPAPEWLTPEVVGRIEDAMLNGDTEDPPPTRTPSSLGDAMRLIGRYTESEGGDSPETTNARRGLFSGYDAWVGAGRPESTTPPPVPPWPGAVLSGLTDEDGVPTWLALAPNVLGEAVRTCVDFPWFVCGSDNASDRTWVEVRAPRAVPEPETERVPWWEVVADQRRLVGFPEVGGTRYGADGCLAFTDHDGVLLANVHDPAIGWDGSGTVEVLSEDP
jgi:hypothetical protein